VRLKGKVCIVTGGGRGIGAATARKFAAEGARVVVADLCPVSVPAMVEEIQSRGQTALGVVVDVTDSASVDRMIKTTLEHFGQLDCLVNNAGITDDARLVKMLEEQWDRVIDVNLKGVYLCTQAAARVMAEQGNGGTILNASSVVGLYGNFGQTNYAAAKWGIIGMTKTWSKELGRAGIRVNAVAPGFILTPMTERMPPKVLGTMIEKTPLGRLGSPEDVANAYAFLASDEAGFITGAVLSVDGGIVL
jgi:3-oxoacyl-[acyl-carrier protein] reductase